VVGSRIKAAPREAVMENEQKIPRDEPYEAPAVQAVETAHATSGRDEEGSITFDGDASDRSLKDDVREVEGALARLRLLRP
jgi:hypothetical protein